MFRGITDVSLDNKNRLLIPAKYRDALEKLVIVPNPIPSEPCLLLYTLDEWERIESDITQKPNTEAIRHLKRFFLGQAVDYKVDSNGRILLTPALKTAAKLNKKLTMVGQGNKFELWDSDTWTLLSAKFFSEDSEASLVNELEELSF